MHSEIIQFWFEEIESSQWWKKDAEFDQMVRERFSKLHSQAANAELFSWRQSAEGRLAEIIVLDQFSRNMFRDTAQAFAYDALALVLAQEAIATGDDLKLEQSRRNFLYMPYMHSESKVIHAEAEILFKENATTGTYEFELKHKVIIDRFGRYPHRNELLGRESTEEEKEFLSKPGSIF